MEREAGSELMVFKLETLKYYSLCSSFDIVPEDLSPPAVVAENIEWWIIVKPKTCVRVFECSMTGQTNMILD
jgi:hypothetical protein